MSEDLKPPPTLATARVLEYAILDDSMRSTITNNLVSLKGPVSRLAVIAATELRGSEGRFDLVYSDREWNVLGIKPCWSTKQAKTVAEELCGGVSPLWTDAGITKEQAAKHLDELCPMWCNFCGLSALEPGEHRFIEKNGSYICESCVKTCFQILQEEREAT
jgi:ClpX C4-type zinc finger protein